MPFKKKKEKKIENNKGEGVVKSIFIAYSILLFHLILLAVLGILVLFFRGVINYMTWIFLGGAVIILGSAWYFIKKIRQEQSTIKEILSLPEFSNKDIEIRLLGGAASFKVGSKKESSKNTEQISTNPHLQLENPVKSRIHDLGELSRLYQENLITESEYQHLKKELLGDSFLNKNSINDFDVLDINSDNYSQSSDNENGDKNE